ncbi:MAG: hypothetical protein AAGU11_04410 [Syntrophobacteraceae bacterium]
MIDDEARKLIQHELQKKAVLTQTAETTNAMRIYHPDGSVTEVENPFSAMQATYAALAADPNAIPELSDESRAAILHEIETGKVAVPIAPTQPEPKEQPRPNRHQRRRAAAIARKRRKVGR